MLDTLKMLWSPVNYLFAILNEVLRFKFVYIILLFIFYLIYNTFSKFKRKA